MIQRIYKYNIILRSNSAFAVFKSGNIFQSQLKYTKGDEI